MDILSLSTLLIIPLIASIAVWFMPTEAKIRRFSKGIAGAHFVYSLLFLLFSNPDNGGYQIAQEVTFWGGKWIEPLGISFSLAIDGISLVLVLLTTFTVLMALIASKNNITEKHKLYYSLIFLLEVAILGVFLARDLFLFFLFWELELIPMYFLISIWGSGRKQYSAMKFILYTFFGSLFMLAAILGLYYTHFVQTGTLSMDMGLVGLYNGYPILLQILAFIGFFIAFAVKLPIVPFHTWLPDAHVDAPTPVSMLLAGVLLKMGAYGLVKINLIFFPAIFKFCSPWIFVLGVVNILYAAMVAFAQKDLKKLIAYSSVSHMGVVLVGLAALNSQGVCGALFQLVAHGIVSAGLFMCVGVIYLRTKTREIEKLGGLAQIMPAFYYVTMIIALASLGLPGLISFPAETLAFYGGFISESFEGVQILTAIAAIGVILVAIYMTSVLRRVFCGNLFSEWKNIKNISTHEMVVLLSLVMLIIVFGVYPNAVANIFASSIESFFSI